MLTGTNANTLIPHYGFVPLEDTVIASWSVTGSDDVVHDLVAYFGLTAAVTVITTTHPALIIPEGFRNSITHSLALTSGSGVMLRDN